MIVSVNDFDIRSPLPERKLPKLETDPVINGETPSNRVNPDINGDEPPNRVDTVGVKSLPLAKKFDIKRFLPIVAIVALVLVIGWVVVRLLIPNLRGAAGETTTELTYWGLWEDNSVVEGLLAEFESKNPGIKVTYKKNVKTDYRSRLQGRLAKTGETEDVPDVFRIHASWIPMMKESLAAVPTNVVTELDMENDFFDTYKADLKDGGKYWAVPLMYDGLAMFYNKSILDSAGVSPPKTWWGFRDLAKKLTVKDEMGKISIAGAAMGVTDNVDHWSDIVGAMMKQNGVDLIKGEEENLKKLKAVLTFYTLFRTSDEVWNETLPLSTQYFGSGKLAFYFAPSWRIFDLEQINPSLDFEVTGIPQLATLEGVDPEAVEKGQTEGNLTNINWSTYWVEGVNNKSKNQKEAWKLLSFLASKESLEKFYKSASQVRSFGEIYPRKSLSTSLSANRKLKAWVDAANTASTWNLASRTHDEAVNDEMIKYFEDAINSIVARNSQIDEVIPTLINGVKVTVQKYNIKGM